MSQLDFAQGGPLPAPRESAIVSMLFLFRIMQILVAGKIATSLSLSKCCYSVRSRSPVIEVFIKGPHRADLGSL
jgi:hypothetical protein